MKDLSVSKFKVGLSAYLREVQDGETLVITEHKRPIAEVRAIGDDDVLLEPASQPFAVPKPSETPWQKLGWKSLLDAERGEP